MNTEGELVRLLERHVPRVLAESLARRAQALGGGDEARTLDELRVRVRIFLDPDAASAVLAELGAGVGVRARPGAERVELAADADVSRARVRARELSLSLGCGAFGAQRVSTVTAELAANVVAYAGRGYLSLVPFGGAEPRLTLRAVDDGPGIGDVDAILAGRFKNKAGRVARGLASVKRLSRTFTVKTSVRGTQVECDVLL